MPQLSRSLSLTVEDGSGLSVCGEDSFEIVNAKRLVPIRGRVNSGHNKNKKTNKASIMSTTYPGPPGRKSNSHDMSTPSPATRTTRLFYTKDRVIDAGITSVQPASWSEKTLPSPHQPQHHRHHRHHHEIDSRQGNGNQLSVEVEQAKTNELIVEQDSPKQWRHQKHLSVNQQETVEHSESTEEQHSQQQTVQAVHDRPWPASTDVSPLALEAISELTPAFVCRRPVELNSASRRIHRWRTFCRRQPLLGERAPVHLCQFSNSNESLPGNNEG